MTDACGFCSEFGSNPMSEAPRLGGERVPDRIVARARDVSMLVSLGPIGTAHLLMIPHRHVGGFAALDSDERSQVGALLRTTTASLRNAGRHIVAFEHGLGDPESPSGGCGVTHAHLHLVAIDKTLASLPRLANSAWRALPDRWLDALPPREDYLLFGMVGSNFWCAPAHDIPSQLLRRWVAGEVGHQEWDWRCHPALGEVGVQAQHLRALLTPMSNASHAG
jgi:diadenosine tetraphosphate (Ap4A) HIT family hydrolase